MYLSIHYHNSIRAFRNIHIKVCPFYWNAFWQRRLVLPNILFCIACPERRFSRLDLVMKLEQIAIAILEPEHCRNFAQQCCNTIAWNKIIGVTTCFIQRDIRFLSSFEPNNRLRVLKWKAYCVFIACYVYPRCTRD